MSAASRAPLSQGKRVGAWTLEAQAHHAEGGCFVLTNHPFISGRPSKAAALEQLVERVTAMDGMWVTTLGAIAAHAQDACTETFVHTRFEVPAFPDVTIRPTPHTATPQRERATRSTDDDAAASGVDLAGGLA